MLKEILTQFKPVLDASLDPMCILNEKCQIIYFNIAMKSFFGLRTRNMSKGPVFCDLLKLKACEKDCQVEKILTSGQPLRLDEHPAVRPLPEGHAKLRMLLSGVPLYAPGQGQGQPVGILLSLRDTTGEVLVHAKYHKLLTVVEEKNVKIQELEDRIADYFRSRRNAA